MDEIIILFFFCCIGLTYGRICGNKCCYGFVLINGTCQKCPLGTFGENCERTCRDNTFGEDCKGTCNCREGFYCNTTYGCTRISDKNNRYQSLPLKIMNVTTKATDKFKESFVPEKTLDMQQGTTEPHKAISTSDIISNFFKENATVVALGVAGLIILGLLLSILVILQRGRRVALPAASLPVQQPVLSEDASENPSSYRVYAEINENLLSELDNEVSIRHEDVSVQTSEPDQQAAHAYSRLQNMTEKDELRAQYTDLGDPEVTATGPPLTRSVREKYEQISRVGRESDDYIPMHRGEQYSL